jgi:TPR repeat protein
MEDALKAWRKAVSMSSGSAMNFLGAYYHGTYNEEVAPWRARANLAPFVFLNPSPETALRFFSQSADNSNASGMRNAGSMLLGDADPPPVYQNIYEGVRLLTRAMKAGESKAAVILGKAFYTGSPRNVTNYAPPPVPAKEQALQFFGKACSDTSDPAARHSAEEFLDRISSPTYNGGGGKLDPSKRPPECS